MSEVENVSTENEEVREEVLPRFREHPEWKNGFSWKVVLGILYGAIVLQPAAIWLGWTVGIGSWTLIGAAEYTALLLFTTMAQQSGKGLSRQEAFVLFGNVGATVVEIVATNFVFFYYVRGSPIARQLGLTDVIPDWWAPYPGTVFRTFFDVHWLPVLVIWIFSLGILLKVADLSLAFFGYDLYVIEERLEFPGTRVWVDACITITEKARRPKRAKILTFSAIFSFIYGFVLYGYGFITGHQLIPIIVDYTPALSIYLPGATFGFVTDLLIFLTGFIMPWSFAYSLLIGALAFYVFGNYLALQYNISPQFSAEWEARWGLELVFQRSQLHLWLSPLIGISVAAGIAPLILHRKQVIRAFSRLTKIKAKTGEMAMGKFFIAFLVATTVSALLSFYLAPDVPLWVYLVLSIGWTLLYMLINARAQGEANVGISIPFVMQGLYYAIGYRGVSGYFVPLIMGGGAIGTGQAGQGTGGVGSAASGWVSVYKGCRLTETKISDYIKGYLVAFPLAFVMSFIYVEAFWKIAPIPSDVYPYTAIFWPVGALWTLIWPAQQFSIFKVDWILIAFIVGLIAGLLFPILGIPFEVLGFSAGVATAPHWAVTMFAGAVFGKIMEKKKGFKWWDNYKSTVAAGLALGEGLAVVISVSIALITKSIWIMPY